jgi:hypothetical protein
MENGPPADFEMHFFHGSKLVYSKGRKMMEMKLKQNDSLELKSVKFDLSISSEKLGLTPEMVILFKHAQDCLRQCVDIESKCAKDASTIYPVILKSSVGKTVSSTAPTSPNPSFHPSSVSIYSIQAPTSTLNAFRASRGMKDAKTSFELPSSENSRPHTPLSRPPLIPRSISSESTALNRRLDGSQRAYLKNIGWCIRQSSEQKEGKYLLLFIDGVSILMDGSDRTLEYEVQNQRPQKYKIDKHLPTDIKVRLESFPRFMQLF